MVNKKIILGKMENVTTYNLHVGDQINIFVVCMPSRKKYITNVLQKQGIFNFILVDAVDGKKLGENTMQNLLIEKTGKSWFIPYNHKVSEKHLGAMGCFLSHHKALELAGDHQAIILEDDVIFNYNAISTSVEIPPLALIVYLGGWRTYKYMCHEDIGLNDFKTKKLIKNLDDPFPKIKKSIKQYGTYAYYCSNPKSILEYMKKFRPRSLDCWYINHIQHKYSCYYYNPSLISHNNDMLSTIDKDGKYRKVCK